MVGMPSVRVILEDVVAVTVGMVVVVGVRVPVSVPVHSTVGVIIVRNSVNMGGDIAVVLVRRVGRVGMDVGVDRDIVDVRHIRMRVAVRSIAVGIEMGWSALC